MKQYHSVVYSPRFPFVVVLLCVVVSLDTTLGSSNHNDLSRAEQDRGGMTIEVSSSNGTSRRTATRKTTKKNATSTPTPTPTPTLQMFLELYPVVKHRSSEEQAHLYMVYKVYLSDPSADLDKYKTVALNAFSCCKDYPHLDISVGCYDLGDYYCQASPSSPYGPDTECYWKGWEDGEMCCRYWPDNRVGYTAWPWNTNCT